MYTSRLTIDTKIKRVLGPHSAQSHSNKEIPLLGSSTTGRQRSRSVSNASTPALVATEASTISLAPLNPPYGMTTQLQSRPSSPSNEDTARESNEYVLAMHDYEPQQSNTCLSFRAGQVIHVLNKDPSGWWDGELEGRRGWFPSNYVNVDIGKSQTTQV
jgi:hypothetical protein